MAYFLDFLILIGFEKWEKIYNLYFIKYCTLTEQIVGNESGKLWKIANNSLEIRF